MAKTLRLLLRVLATGYGLAVACRNRLFDSGMRKANRLPRPVISVGNLTAGGTGKTPLVIHLAEHLRSMQALPAVLLRGYKAQNGLSDEAQLLRQALGDEVAVVADVDRSRGASQAMQQQPNTRVFLLDDGFQHRQTHRDLDLVLVDATCPFGFGYLLPRGLLREPISTLRRASAVIVTRADQVHAEQLADLDDRIADLTGMPPIAHISHRWTKLLDERGQTHAVDELREAAIVAAAGIGNPGAFFDMLERRCRHVLWSRALADHQAPQRSELLAMLNRAKADGATAMITTDKDWVKWARLLNGDAPVLPIFRPRLSIDIIDGEHAIHALLRKTANSLR